MPVQFKVVEWQIKLVIGLVIVAIIVGLFLWWLYGRDEKKELRGTVQQQGQTAQAATAIAGQASAQQAQSHRVETAAEAQQVEIIHRYEELKNANPQVRAFADTPVPPELRDIARAARLARERLGCTETGCPADDAGAPGAGQGDAR